MLRAFEPVGEELDLCVELYTATGYSGIIEAMRSGKVDAAWFRPLSYILTADVADAEAIAVQLKEEGGEPAYHSLMVTRPGSGTEEVEDLKGKKFSFIDLSSTSGYLFPSKAFEEAGVNLDEDLEATFAGGHNTSALVVKNGVPWTQGLLLTIPLTRCSTKGP